MSESHMVSNGSVVQVPVQADMLHCITVCLRSTQSGFQAQSQTLWLGMGSDSHSDQCDQININIQTTLGNISYPLGSTAYRYIGLRIAMKPVNQAGWHIEYAICFLLQIWLQGVEPSGNIWDLMLTNKGPKGR